MAIEFKKNSSRDVLYALAVQNGISVAEGADRPAIIAALEAHNAAKQPEAHGVTDNVTPGENAMQDGEESAQDAQDSDKGDQTVQGGTEQPGMPGETDDTTAGENSTQSDLAAENDEYNMFAYVGPTLPHGRLKENAIFRGKIKDVLAYLANVLEDYPQVAKLIVPTHKLAVYSAKAKTPGNVANKYYTDIVSTMRGNREV